MVRYLEKIDSIYCIDNDLNATERFIALNNLLCILVKDTFIDEHIKRSLDVFIHCLMLTEMLNINKEKKEGQNK